MGTAYEKKKYIYISIAGGIKQDTECINEMLTMHLSLFENQPKAAIYGGHIDCVYDV